MSTNYVQDGKVLTYSNTGSAISAGDVIVISKIMGVALEDIAATTGTGAVQIEGVLIYLKSTRQLLRRARMLFGIRPRVSLTITPRRRRVGMCQIAALQQRLKEPRRVKISTSS